MPVSVREFHWSAGAIRVWMPWYRGVANQTVNASVVAGGVECLRHSRVLYPGQSESGLVGRGQYLGF
jgi:hypothetical protein